MKRLIVALAMCAIGDGVRAAADEDDGQRARIRNERAQAQQLYEARERTCNERFAVTSCLDEARAQRRQTLERLRREELVLEDAKRKERVAARTARIREKQSAEESKPAPLVVQERPDAPRKPSPKALPSPPSSAAASAAPRISEEQARRNTAAFEAKRKQAAEHRAEIEQRNAQRSSKAKPSVPLPVPGGASAP